MAQLHRLASGDLPVLVDVVENHLLMLDGGESLLARVGRFSGIPGVQFAGKNVFANGLPVHGLHPCAHGQLRHRAVRDKPRLGLEIAVPGVKGLSRSRHLLRRQVRRLRRNWPAQRRRRPGRGPAGTCGRS